MAQQQLFPSTPAEILILSAITPQDAQALLEFMRARIPAPKQLNPAMTWEESHNMSELFERVRAILYCIAGKGVNHAR